MRGTRAFVGGSLVPIGGHNLLEPAAMGVPVLTGPELANFTDVAEALRERQALVEVTDAVTLAEALARLLGDAAERERLAAAGRAVVEANRGALRGRWKAWIGSSRRSEYLPSSRLRRQARPRGGRLGGCSMKV